MAVLYNLIVVVGRAVFWELDNLIPATWLLLDYACDFLYVVDTFIRMHEGVYSVDIFMIGFKYVSIQVSLCFQDIWSKGCW